MKTTTQKSGHRKTIVLCLIFLVITIMALGLDATPNRELASGETPKIAAPTVLKDSIASVAAFKKVYRVLMSPRCMNCHPSGEIPLQGDDSHLHTMSPKRGLEGKGLYAMKCANCHQPSNSPGLHTPPGNPNWHLPPANMKMVFQGRSANQLARQLVDKKQNGNKDFKQLVEHADDGLVLSGWNPGPGRTKPPLSHAEFKKAWNEWLNTGAYAPKK
jgi:hypothetical protein